MVEGCRKRSALRQSDIRTLSWMIRSTALTEKSKETITEWWPIPLADPKEKKETLAKKTFTPESIKKIFGHYYPS